MCTLSLVVHYTVVFLFLKMVMFQLAFVLLGALTSLLRIFKSMYALHNVHFAEIFANLNLGVVRSLIQQNLHTFFHNLTRRTFVL